MLEELYQEIILDHYRRPRNKGKVAPADLTAHESNPLCGDEIDVTAKVVDGKITDLKFDGRGCSICTASASIMTQKLLGKTIPEAEAFIEQFLLMMRGDTPFGGKEMGDLKALEGVLKFPVRVKCATLAWHTTQKGIDDRNRQEGVMPHFQKHFSLEEARALLPQLRNILQDAQRRRQRFSEADEKLGKMTAHAGSDLGGKDVSSMMMDLHEVNLQVRRILEMGVVIKDFDRGLVDFPHLRQGREVFLCWELDEDDIEFWHDIETGYGGRERL